MGLIHRGPHTVTVTPRVKVTDSMGTTIRDGTPVQVTGVAVQPVSAEESEALGTQALTTYRIIGAGQWPGGVQSKVRVDVGPYTGRTFDQQGEARVYGMSPRTAHFDVLVTARGSEVR